MCSMDESRTAFVASRCSAGRARKVVIIVIAENNVAVLYDALIRIE